MRSARLWTTRVGLPCQPWFFLCHVDPACHHLVLFGVTNNKSVANPNKNRERLGRFTDSCRWPFPLRVFNQLGSEFSRRCLVSIAVTSSEREGREERNRAENAAATSRRHYRSGSVNWVGGASAVPGKVGIASRLLKGPRGALNCSPVRADHRRSPWPGLYMLPSPVRYPSPDSQSALL